MTYSVSGSIEDRLADALHRAKITGALIPSPVGCVSLEEAYTTQERVFEKRPAEVAAWKLGATSELAQERMGLSNPVAGRLAASDIRRESSRIEAAPNMVYAEAELAVMLDSDLRPRMERYEVSEVASAVGAVYAAIELCTSRYIDDEVDAPALVADNAFAYRLVLGRTLALGWNPMFQSMAVTLDCGSERLINGSTAAVMGNPIKALTWLANWLSSRGEGLKRGQVIATGSCTGITQVSPGETVRALFAGAEGATATIIPRRKAGESDEY